PDAVLLDVRLPKMNGIEVLRRIRSIDQALTVIIITGLATKSEITEARELGVTEVIEKSYVLKNFSESLARAVNKRSRPKWADTTGSLRRSEPASSYEEPG